MHLILLRRSWSPWDVPAAVGAWWRRATGGLAAAWMRWRGKDWSRDVVWLALVALIFLVWLWVLWTGSINRRH